MMNDNEIIKALECCTNGVCAECPKVNSPVSVLMCQGNLIGEALEFINRQQEEIERFKKIETTVDGFWEEIQKLAMFKDKEIPTLEELLEYMDNLKIEVIKEVAERLKEKADWCYTGNIKKLSYRISAKNLDTFVKEMVGDTE
ncbi:MAG: hypothetical protein U0K91_02240 [Acutalibacteraceae bacterium]|nr:hypothetical protein [Acutalibacteraceae bacterium]